MMANLSDKILSIPQREKGGALATNRLGFQRSAAICKLLELHEKFSDYVLLVEVHDDVVVLDSTLNPVTIEFIQVKSRASTTHWVKSDLVARKKSSKDDGSLLPSYLGKLYNSLLLFPEHTSRLSFLSNRGYSLKRDDGSSTKDAVSVRLSDVGESDRTYILERIKKEHNLSTEPAESEKVFFEVCALSVTEHATFALGRVADFLSKNEKSVGVSAHAFHRTLAAELERRGRREELPSDFSELVAKHGICRREFDEMLRTAAAQASGTPIHDRVEAQLRSENAPYRVVTKLAAAARRFVIDRLRGDDPFLQKAGEEARVLLEKATSATLLGLLDEVKPRPGGALAQVEAVRGLEYRMALVAVVSHEEDGTIQISSDDSKDQNESA